MGVKRRERKIAGVSETVIREAVSVKLAGVS